LKRQSKVKQASKKSSAAKVANKPAEVAQKPASIRPDLAGQLSLGERDGPDGGQTPRLSQVEILQLQRLHGNNFVQRLLAEFAGEKNGTAIAPDLLRQEEEQEYVETIAAGQNGATGIHESKSSSPATGSSSGSQKQPEVSAKKGVVSTESQAAAKKTSVGATTGQNKQQTGPGLNGSNGNHSRSPVNQSGVAPGKQEEQPGSGNQTNLDGQAEPAPKGEKKVESEQETRVEETKEGNAETSQGVISQAGKTKGPGKAGQKAKPTPESSQESKQVAQAPGLASTTDSSSTGEQRGGPVTQGQSPPSAEEDPDFQNTVNQVKHAAENQKAHAPAESKAQEAQAAAEAPASEVKARAQANQAQEMERADSPPFDAAGFKAQLMQRLQALTPSTAQGAEQFKSSNKAGGLKAELKGKVESEGKKSKRPLEEKSKQAPNTGAVPLKTVTPLQQLQTGPMPIIPTAKQATPKPKSQNEVEEPLQQSSQTLDDKMRQAEITEEQLGRSNEPEFQQALDQKKQAQEQAEEEPQTYREEEQEQISQAQTEATGTAEDKLADMHGRRQEALTQVGSKQDQTKGADEQKRAQVAADIQGIFTNTQANVEQILGELDGRVDAIFNSGAGAAKQAFENYVDSRMRAYKEERYSGPIGILNWAKDKLLGMPSEVNAFFQQGRQLYLEQMDGVIDNVVSAIGGSLQQAKQVIAQGRADIDVYVAQLPANLQEVGQRAAGEIMESFNQLESQVEDTQNALIDELANMYNQHLQEIDSRVTAMRAENQGLLQQAMDAISGVVNTILQIKDRLISILASAASAVKEILRDPIAFLGNLISAISTGFQSFLGNIAAHLADGLVGWVIKALGEAGIDLPESFDLKGIFGMVTQVLGVTWDAIRNRAGALLGDSIVGLLEQSFELFIIIRNKGLSGIWDLVTSSLGNLQEIILEPIKEFLVVEVIQNGIQKILGLLNPAGAFIEAVQSIYRVMSFFAGNAVQIASLVQTIMGSMLDIAGGAIGQTAQAIENVLARAMPTVINFLAHILGLGGLAEKIKSIIQRIRSPIDRVLNWILSMAVRAARKIGGALGGGGENAAGEGG